MGRFLNVKYVRVKVVKLCDVRREVLNLINFFVVLNKLIIFGRSRYIKSKCKEIGEEERGIFYFRFFFS